MWKFWLEMLKLLLQYAHDRQQWAVHYHVQKAIDDIIFIIDTEGDGNG